MNTDASEPIRFDDSLPCFVSIVDELLGTEALQRHLILRDADGLLSLIMGSPVDDVQRTALENSVRGRLGAYAATCPVGTAEELYDDDLQNPLNDVKEYVEYRGTDGKPKSAFVNLVERRILGEDWQRNIRTISEPPGTPQIIVFASLKGGVGRSTALAVSAKHLASSDRNVLVVDLDLEAPGVGSMFLDQENLPRYGLLDYFTEIKHADVDNEFLQNMVATSPLSYELGGLVSVAPAAGKQCRAFPQNVLRKLSQTYLEQVDSSGSRSFLDQTRGLISRLCNTGKNQYDVVLVDTRAGLNESTAASIIGLRAFVLFFAIDQPQTWEDYSYLFAHWARFRPIELGHDEEDWRANLQMVHAKASASSDDRALFRDRAFDVLATHLYDILDEDSANDTTPTFNFDLDDMDAPHYAWPILFDSNLINFNPLSNPSHLEEAVYMKTFDSFLESLLSIIRGR